jgi:NAD(P)H-nitrite reductase large subunit
MQYIVVGAGPAGVIAAETLRRTDRRGQVILISGESEPPYSRMAIPYLLMGNIDEAGTYLRKSQGHYGETGIDLKYDTVTATSPGQKQVTLGSGETLSYDKLLVATGSRAVLPPVSGMDAPGVHTCWTLEDARHIAERTTTGSKVLLIGAGFIGCIVLEALAARGVDLTVVEMGDRMVPRMMNETAGGLIKAWCENKGVRVHTSTQVTAIEQRGEIQESGLKQFFSRISGKSDTGAQAGSALTVRLSNGDAIEADVVISAAGVKPNLELLQGSDVRTDQGILVNEFLQSSDPHIYAAGDCAQASDFSTGEATVHAIQPTASEHGRFAAQNMAGKTTPYEGSFNMNVLDTLGLISSSFGLWMGVEGGEQTELSDPGHFRYLNLQFRDDVMVGATSLGMTQHVGVLRGLIQGEPRLGVWKDRLMSDPTKIMEAYLNTGLAYR